jgi:hypothetical protein
VLTVRDLAVWSVSLCRLVYSYQCFQGVCCFHFQGSSLFLEWTATCSNRRNLSTNVFLFVNSEDFCVSVCPIFPYSFVSVCPIFPYSSVSVCPIFPYSCVSVCPIFPDSRVSVCPIFRYSCMSVCPIFPSSRVSARYSLIPVCLSVWYSPIPVYLSARYFPLCRWWVPKHILTLVALLPTLDDTDCLQFIACWAS